MTLLFCILYTLFHRILVITAIGPIQELVRLDHRNEVFVVVCDRAAAPRRRWCVSHFETVLGVRVTLLNAFLLVEIIYAGLESSTRLNSSAYVRAQNCTLGVWTVYARTKYESSSRLILGVKWIFIRHFSISANFDIGNWLTISVNKFTDIVTYRYRTINTNMIDKSFWFSHIGKSTDIPIRGN